MGLIPLVFVALFPASFTGVPLDAAEIDAFPPAQTLALWAEVCGVTWAGAAGDLERECGRHWYALRNLTRARQARDGGHPAAVVKAWLADAFQYRPEWRFRPFAVEIVPYRLLPKK